MQRDPSINRAPRSLARGKILRGALVVAALGAIGVTVGAVAARGGSQNQVPTTAADFFMPGTQPNPNSETFTPIFGAINCTYCHSDYGVEVAPFAGDRSKPLDWTGVLTLLRRRR